MLLFSCIFLEYLCNAWLLVLSIDFNWIFCYTLSLVLLPISIRGYQIVLGQLIILFKKKTFAFVFFFLVFSQIKMYVISARKSRDSVSAKEYTANSKKNHDRCRKKKIIIIIGQFGAELVYNSSSNNNYNNINRLQFLWSQLMTMCEQNKTRTTGWIHGKKSCANEEELRWSALWRIANSFLAQMHEQVAMYSCYWNKAWSFINIPTSV